ncbi:acyl-CoA thioesterase II [Algiphilus sp. W345]|uniref:Acyl-CoA thioesterase II n=1 Tax=Banduia mediterranea TaxID=3075609 RepID=A0ABU2WFS6_9GAMM|nr:acyl-CoA thioesterase II [Algiphilus sp. W345]MDT0496156.1 acyl-CoA thioesterase II [Algiphilus sp. W345]
MKTPPRASDDPAETAVREVIDALTLEPTGPDRYRVRPREFGRRRLFGGQVFAQSLMAAQHSAPERPPHSVHACFLLPGTPDIPVDFEVERVRDGGAFSCRHVRALQGGREILTMFVSCQRPEAGYEHQCPMPDVPAPESLRSSGELLREWTARTGEIPHAMLETSMTLRMGLELRPLDPEGVFGTLVRPPQNAHWFRICRKVPVDPALHRGLLAFASDLGFLGTALRPHGKPWFAPDIQPSTIDHSLWLHRSVRVDDWLLYVMDSPTAQGARGFVRGSIYDRAGRLVASTAQDGLLRDTRLRHSNATPRPTPVTGASL